MKANSVQLRFKNKKPLCRYCNSPLTNVVDSSSKYSRVFDYGEFVCENHDDAIVLCKPKPNKVRVLNYELVVRVMLPNTYYLKHSIWPDLNVGDIGEPLICLTKNTKMSLTDTGKYWFGYHENDIVIELEGDKLEVDNSITPENLASKIDTYLIWK